MKTLSDELTAAIRPLEWKLKLLWVGVFPSFGIYIFLAWKRAQLGSETAAAAFPQMLMIAAFLGLTVLAQSFLYRWYTLSPRAIANMLAGRQPALIKRLAHPKSPKVRAVIKPDILERLDGEERTLYEYSNCLFNVILCQWGMVNTCALFGMILPPLKYQPLAAIIAGCLSTACMLLHFPSIGNSFAAGLELVEFEKSMRRD